MPSLHEQFNSQLQDALQRVSPKSVHANANGNGLDEPTTNISVGISIHDFYAYMPMHNYIFLPTNEFWPPRSVNSRLPPQTVVKQDGSTVLDQDGQPITLKASDWLDKHKSVEQITWAPGEPRIISDRLVSEGGWIAQPGCRCFNLYRPPTVVLGDPRKADPWIDHIRLLYGSDTLHILRWLAHRVQRPEEKINHALVLSGSQGIGKDALLEPVKTAIGPWNFIETLPQQLLGRFNGFLKSVILRVSEARDLGDIDRFKFYEHTKAYIASPPDVLRVDEKNLREYSVINVCGVIITSNHKSDGIFLPPDDRRHFVAWSNLTNTDFSKNYWSQLWGFYARGGTNDVAAYLHSFDISDFDPKAPPPKTAAWWDIVTASRPLEDAELADALDQIGNPTVTTLAEVAPHASTEFGQFLSDRRNSVKIPRRFDACGYVAVRNGDAKDGLWKINGRRQVIYAKKALSEKEQRAALQAKYDR